MSHYETVLGNFFPEYSFICCLRFILKSKKNVVFLVPSDHLFRCVVPLVEWRQLSSVNPQVCSRVCPVP